MNLGTPTDRYVSVNDAAKHLGIKAWAVRRLLDAGHIRSVTLVDTASLLAYKDADK